jgi:elongation factor Tu
MGGDNFTGTLKLRMPAPMYEGIRFALREGGRTVGGGVVTKLLPDDPEDLKTDNERKSKKAAKSGTKKK